MIVRLPGQRAETPSSQRNEGTWIALIFSLGIVGGILALISLVMPDIFGVLLVLAAFGGFVSLHYFTWGRWLIKREGEREKEKERSTPP